MIKKRNRQLFFLITFDLVKSKNKTALYNKVYKLISKEVGERNFYRTLRQFCVVKTNIEEDSLIELVKSICGEECNIAILQLTSVPKFFLYDEKHTKDTERLIFDMETEDMFG